MLKRIMLAGVLLAVFAGTATAAPRYGIIALPELRPGDFLFPTAINRRGDVVGYSGLNENELPFVWRGGITTGLSPLPGDPEGTAFAINDAGRIVGESRPASFAGLQAVAWNADGSAAPLLDPAGNFRSAASGINRHGDTSVFIQYSSDNRDVEGALVRADGSVVRAGRLESGGYSQALGINDDATIVGLASFGAGERPFVKTADGAILGLDLGLASTVRAFGAARAISETGMVAGDLLLGSASSIFTWTAGGGVRDLGRPFGSAGFDANVLGLNNSGTLVGFGRVTGFAPLAWMWTENDGFLSLTNLLPNNSGWLLLGATAINDRGQIVGFGIFDGQLRGFRMSAVPEPMSWLLLITGFGLVGTIRRRHREALRH
jgi:uncharacterized membrane protein